jgi:ubiquinol oxidase
VNISRLLFSFHNHKQPSIKTQQALTKLLERQQRDVQQTLDLIQSLDLESISHYEQDDDNDTNSTLSYETPSIALSVASGADYGYVSRSEGCKSTSSFQQSIADARFQDYGPPGNIWSLGSQQFMRNLRAMFNEYRDEEDNPSLTDKQRELQAKLQELTLDSSAIWERERQRGPLVAPLIIKIPYLALCHFLDVVFENRNPFSRFFLLETVARMPYFSYISMLHLYETLGFWRRSSDIKRIHFAEEWNEFHHLLIMESLGGDQPYWVRFMAQHSALAYYVALCILWGSSPTLSYKFSEMLETHAVDTYGQFVDENEDKLKKLPPSMAAVEYYTVGVSDPMFGEYQTASVDNPHGVRKPGTNLRSLYDVFVAIRKDEGDHVSTMKSCLDPEEATLSPALESRVLTGVALASAVGYLFGDSATLDSLTSTLNQLSSSGGLQGLEGLADLADGATDLDSVLSEAASSDVDGSIINGVVGGLAGLANGIRGMTGLDPELDEDAVDAAGSALEEAAAGGLDGLEIEGIMEIVRNVAVGILELIGML